MIDPDTAIQYTTTIIAILGIIGTYITSVIGKRYLSIISAFLSLLSTYYKKIQDGIITEEEYAEIGKDFVLLAQLIDRDEAISTNIPKE